MTTVSPFAPFKAELRRFARRIRRRVSLAVSGEADDTFFDLRNLTTINRLFAEHGEVPLVLEPRHAEESVEDAAWFVLALLAGSKPVRDRFPRAISEGANGDFATWLTTAGADEFRLSPSAVANLREAFDAGYGPRGEKLLDIRFDLCREFPLALTPAHRGRLLDWFLRFGHDTDASLLDLFWHLFAIEETPDRGLVAMYLLQPEWQKEVPHALTIFGWDDFKRWLSNSLNFRCRWFRMASLEPRERPWDELALLVRAEPELRASFPREGDAKAIADWLAKQGRKVADPVWHSKLAEDIAAGLPKQSGINVLSLFRYTSGLQQAALGTVDALNGAGVRTELRDLPIPHKREVRDRRGLTGLERFDTTLIITGLDTPPLQAYHLASLHPQPGTFRIATWWWELEELPAAYQNIAQDVDEIWAPTTFIAKALKSLGKPVQAMLPGVRLPAFETLPKSHFGLSPTKFCFLFVFDMNSRMPRKNPLGLIRAFRLAFRRDEPVELVIKVSPQERFYPEWWAELRAAAREAGVKLIDRSLERGELLALMDAADAYVSLHRSEGFGLTLAESMLLGKPTIATGYSGNLDFMTTSNSYLVNYSRVKIAEEIAPYPRGSVWAEPDVHHAAMLMGWVYEHPAEARVIGERGRSDMKSLLSVEAAGQRMAARLAEIEGGSSQ